MIAKEKSKEKKTETLTLSQRCEDASKNGAVKAHSVILALKPMRMALVCFWLIESWIFVDP